MTHETLCEHLAILFIYDFQKDEKYRLIPENTDSSLKDEGKFIVLAVFSKDHKMSKN